MSMDLIPVGPAGSGEPDDDQQHTRRAALAAPRTGAFGALHTRWLLLWAGAGAVLISAVFAALGELGTPASDELLSALLYLPVIAWIWFMVVRRGGVRLRRHAALAALGTYWFVVAGILVVQFMFSLAAITLTELVAPWMDDSLAGVGQGNLLLALIGIVILPPLVEEITFRGILLERFAVKWRVGVAVIVSAVFFGILHADPIGAGMFGVVTGLLYLRTGSLWPGIIIHFVNNLVAVIAIRVAGSEAATQTPTLSESLTSAGLFLVLSLPFLVWFIWTHWPARGSLTPYQRYEIQAGLPPRMFRAGRMVGRSRTGPGGGHEHPRGCQRCRGGTRCGAAPGAGQRGVPVERPRWHPGGHPAQRRLMDHHAGSARRSHGQPCPGSHPQRACPTGGSPELVVDPVD